MSRPLPGHVNSRRFAGGRSNGVPESMSLLPPVTHEPSWEPTPVLPGGGECAAYVPTRQELDEWTVVPVVTPPASFEEPALEVTEMFPSMSLAEVNARASLQTRVDNKYLLTEEEFLQFARSLAVQNDWSIVEVGGKRQFNYRSVYFDTPDLLTFRQHRQGRRKRFKFRTRSYVDSGDCMFEVKLRGARSSTVKERLSYDIAHAEEITPDGYRFISEVLGDAYGMNPPQGLRRSARTDYQRLTLVQHSQLSRLTCDSAFTCSAGGSDVRARPMRVVETKTENGRGSADRMLTSMGIRPRRISKYCLAAAMLYPHLSANKWNRARREWF